MSIIFLIYFGIKARVERKPFDLYRDKLPIDNGGNVVYGGRISVDEMRHTDNEIQFIDESTRLMPKEYHY